MKHNILDSLSSDPDKREEEAHFTRVAATFDQVKPFISSHFGRRLVEFAGIMPGASVLDIACGRGASLFPAVEKVGPGGSVVGIDLSAGMAAETGKEISARGIPNARVMQMDAEHMEFEDEQFDVVLCAFALQHFARPEAHLAEMLRVLKKGGQVAIATWGRNRDPRWRWLLPLRDTFMPPEPEPVEITIPRPEPDFGTTEGMSAFLTAVGLADPRAG